MQSYIAIIHKDADSDFGVSFPDFPGCITAGETLDEARRLAEEALAFHVRGMIEDGEVIPAPSSLDAVMEDEDFRDGVAFLVSLRDEAQAVRVNITIQASDLAAIDRFANAHGFTRSGLLVRAAKDAMAREGQGAARELRAGTAASEAKPPRPKVAAPKSTTKGASKSKTGRSGAARSKSSGKAAAGGRNRS